MRQKFRNNLIFAAPVKRNPPQSGDAATKIGALSDWASCAVQGPDYQKYLQPCISLFIL